MHVMALVEIVVIHLIVNSKFRAMFLRAKGTELRIPSYYFHFLCTRTSHYKRTILGNIFLSCLLVSSEPALLSNYL